MLAERVTFIIKADNRSDVLARVLKFFDDSNVEVEALYMVRRRGAQTLPIHVTIEANQEGRQRMQAGLSKVAHVSSVKTEPAAKEVLSDPRDKRSTVRPQR